MAGSKKLKIFLVFVLSVLLFFNSVFSEEVCNLDNAVISGYLQSPIFDLGSSYNLTKISWQGEKTEKHFVGFQIASANSTSGPWIFYGENFSNNYIDIQPFTFFLFNQDHPHKSIRYFKYRVFLGSCEDLSSPQVDKIIIYYRK